jgi:hypothetical protein
VSGLPRQREWDVTAIVELPELERSSAEVLDATVRGDDDSGLPESLLAELDRALTRPYAVRLVRRGPRDWSVGARGLRSEAVDLGPLAAGAFEVVVSPAGERSALVDGEPPAEWVEPAVAEALAELERRGRARFQAFVARADRVSQTRWELTIDPL